MLVTNYESLGESFEFPPPKKDRNFICVCIAPPFFIALVIPSITEIRIMLI